MDMSETVIRVVKNKSNPQSEPKESIPVIAESYPTDLASTLQYGQGFGDLKLLQFAREHVKVVPPRCR
jgi:hypothetical protein